MVFHQFKRFLLGLSPFPGNVRRVVPGFSLAVDAQNSGGLRNPSGKGKLQQQQQLALFVGP